MQFWKALIVGGIALGLAACGRDHKKNISADDSNISQKTIQCEEGATSGEGLLPKEFGGIVNGRSLKQNSPVAARTVSILFKEGQQGGICTGTLLPNNIILTAAHCTARKASDMMIVFNSNLACVDWENASSLKSSLRPVEQMVVHTDYDKSDKADKLKNLSSDIALLKYSGSIPAGYKTAELPLDSVSIQAEETVIMAGYGVTEFQGEGSGVLRVASQPGSSFSELPEAPKSRIVIQADQGVCSGDSGGPLFVVREGKLAVIGIASAVANPNNPEKNCSGLAFYLNPAKQAEFVRNSYRSLTGIQL